jgi:hypothetical protein
MSTTRLSMAPTWTTDELDRIGAAEELQLASQRADGTSSKYVTMWVVRVGDELFVRSAHGSSNPWYRTATNRGLGAIRAGGVTRDVAFARAPDGVDSAIDAAYHSKYDRYGARIVGAVVGATAAPNTIRLVPR